MTSTTAKLQQREKILGICAAALMMLMFYMIFVFVPTERTMGIVQRIFYVHVPAAFTGFLAFIIVGWKSFKFLKTRDEWYDRSAIAAAELGVIFTTINLVTGMLWAKPAWNVYWSWDPRLTTLFILWFIYVAYLMMRSFMGDDEKGARFAAVYAIVGTVDIPIVYFSIWWWRTIHPQPVIIGGGEDSGLHPDMSLTLWVSVAALFTLFFFLYYLRLRLAKSNEVLVELRKKVAFAAD